MRNASTLQKRREKRAARRRFLGKKRRGYLKQFGGFIGEQMYRRWQRKEKEKCQ